MRDNDHLTGTAVSAAASALRASAITELRQEGGDDFLLDLIKLYIAETPVRLESLATALNAGDRIVVQRAAHTLKSTAAIFGADEMTTIAASTEMAARAGRLREAARLFPALRAATERVRSALLTLQAALPPTPS